ISNVTYQGSVWLSTSPYASITSAVEGAALNLGEAMTPITLNYTVNANASSGSSGSQSSSSFAYLNGQVGSGDFGSCGILGNGSVMCWGQNPNGELGNGATSNTHARVPVFVSLPQGRTAVSLGVGWRHICAILDNASLMCWGNNYYDQLGLGYNQPDKVFSPEYVNLGTDRTAVAVAGGLSHTCAILDDGSMKCWGRDNYGQLGDGGYIYSNANTQPIPVSVNLPTGRTAVDLTAGYSHNCAILDNGSLTCWGLNHYGQVGNDTGHQGGSHATPVHVDLGTGRTAVDVAGGASHTCAILDNGDLKCWGRHLKGQLGVGGPGNGSSNFMRSPPATAVDLGTGRTAVALTAGTDHTCAILNTGETKCWGWDNYGQLGDGATSSTGGWGPNLTSPSSTPIDFGTSRTAVAIAAGVYHTCAVVDNGSMMCWGDNTQGKLGLGNATNDGTGEHQDLPISTLGTHLWDTTTTTITWETHPALPAGMSISGGTISGTPSVYALNQTYTIYANQSGYSTTHELYFSVDTDHAHTVVENQTIDPIGFHPPFNNGTTTWTV
ncbi:MAG: RCC1 domain-containing protein, partial [Poseidonia sp.]